MSAVEVVPKERAIAAALAGLPGATPTRLGHLFDYSGGSVLAAWEALSGSGSRDAVPQTLGLSDDTWRAWRKASASVDLAEVSAALSRLGISATIPGWPDYPLALLDDHARPAVLFWRGSPEQLDAPAVAIIGTRRCTHYGREVARSLGEDLSRQGITVVSGLAAGIDGAAHEGVLRAPNGSRGPVGVVGSGLDVVYPSRHRSLWSSVGERGFLVSEAPPGAPPEAWRFPARNRIIAALADVVVVVESRLKGGSMHTVEAAVERSIPVMAVPGSVRSPASEGANQLLADGCAPVRNVEDVLCALELVGAVTRQRERLPADDGARVRDDPGWGEAESKVMNAIGWEAVSFQHLLERTGFAPGPLAGTLASLEESGAVFAEADFWQRS